MLRTSSKPAVSQGTRIMEARKWGGASGSVTAITTANAAPSAPELAGAERSQPSFLLRLGPRQLEQLHVPDVRRLRVDAVVTERAPTQLLREDRELLQRHSQVRHPESQGLRPRPGLAQRWLQRAPGAGEPRFERHRFPPHELPRPLPQVLRPLRDREVHQ